MRLLLRRAALLVPAATIAAAPLVAQTGRTVTETDYARAERFLAQNLTGLVVGGTVAANWLPDERFWYRNQTQNGTVIVVVDPARKMRSVHSDCAAAGVDCSSEVPATAGQGRGRGGRGSAAGGTSSEHKPL